MMSNKDTYEAPDVVRVYAGLKGLQKPEETIFRELADRLPNMRMLDVGVGGGRTTHAFASLVKEYIGIDYSANMIESCQRQLSSFPRHVSFVTCDVRDMSIFPDHSFDFVLFSYNGIDYLSHEGRLQALRELKRVAKKGGLVCFSTHNLRSLLGPPLPRWSAHPARFLWRVAKYCLSLFEARPFAELGKETHAIVNDGAHESRLMTYYVLPEEQLRQLANSGFGNIRVFSLESGKELPQIAKMSRIRDRWLYYLCEAG